jgi:hypothetical protein
MDLVQSSWNPESLHNKCGHSPERNKEAHVAMPNEATDLEKQAAEQSNGSANVGVRGPEKWAPQFWANPRQVALRFASGEELDAAIDWLWSVQELRELPRVHVGQNTMVIPAGAVDLFRKKGFRFTQSLVVSAGELPAEEVNRIRREG